MLQNFREMKVNMSLKIHILYSHLDSFPKNFGALYHVCNNVAALVYLKSAPKSGAMVEAVNTVNSVNIVKYINDIQLQRPDLDLAQKTTLEISFLDMAICNIAICHK